MPAMLTKPPGIIPRAYVSSCSMIGPLTFLNTYKTLSNAALYALMTVLSIIDHASTTFLLKIKEAIHIQWEKPSLKHQFYHVNLKL